jgi:formamidopyrimidine-DNA glycosylase
MPELPEVETVVRYISPFIRGKTVKSVVALNNYSKVFATHNNKTFNNLVSDKTIVNIWRRAKFIVMDLSVGHILIHLRMTGRLLIKISDDDNPKHLTVHLQFTDGNSIYFKDYRKFGRWYYYENLDALENRLGVEPLSSEFTSGWLYKNLQSRSRQLKPLLLDQAFIAGLGNIYVDEVLWKAKLHPQKLSSTVSRKKSNVLHGAIKRILSRAIEQQGTTIINFYFGEKAEGSYRDELQVFGKEDFPCPRCQTILKKIKVGQRGTHLCPKCQRK